MPSDALIKAMHDRVAKKRRQHQAAGDEREPAA